MSWRQFNFFEKEQVDFNIANPSACCNGVFIGDMQGNVHQCNRSLKPIMSFKAYPNRITHLKFIKKKSILLSIGEDEVGVPNLKVWHIEKDKDNSSRAQAPGLTRSTRITHGSKIFPVTAFAVLDNLTQVAIGLENGVVILIRGDVSRDRVTKSRIVHEGTEIITGLGFREDENGVFLYIATMARVLICPTTVSKDATLIDVIASEPGNTVLTPQERNQEMLVANSEAVYFYGPEGKGPCFIIGGYYGLKVGEKTKIAWYRGYLMTISKEITKVEERSSEVAAKSPASEPNTGTVLTIYDLKGKYIAYRDDFGKRIFDPRAAKAIGEPIKHVIADANEIFVITEHNNAFRLREIDLATKLDTLYTKHLYNVAMNIVLQPPSDIQNVSKFRNSEDLIEGALQKSEDAVGTIVDICKRYGDYLYGKGEYDSAMKQYMRTISHLQPSYVIRKYLDAQRLHNLTAYLQALHDRQLANSNHTTLLLNCYTKLHDMSKIDEFIDTSLTFDVETAITVCRQASFFQQALRIASKFQQHDWFIKIQIEDLELYDESIEYLTVLPEPLFSTTLTKYGHLLVTKRPEKMTAMLIETLSRDDCLKFNDVVQFYATNMDWCAVYLEGVLKTNYQIQLEEINEASEFSEGDREDICIICDTLLDIYLTMRQSNRNPPNLKDKRVNWDDKISKFLESGNVSTTYLGYLRFGEWSGSMQTVSIPQRGINTLRKT
ncbi:Vacuolar protein sorting-associated protein 11 [Boothiomyces macroporosus]|uniref:Vacuolar protein sorting-associated protein 11 n=1 Tax=Boothiomyces macroporosus TaxID=261099 RepID=A0AAD5UAD1_9FUNG|nr:Vacuolar protein sorting-associated protein 11 [Boothiomyces macroporosus]